jgi:hypothetical protein
MTGIWAVVFLCVFVLSKAAMIECEFYNRYDNRFQQVEREHDRQLIFGELIQSQQAWERSNDALRTAYSDERSARIKLKKQNEIMKYEMYVFMRFLRNHHPGVAEDVLDKLGPPNAPLKPKPNSFPVKDKEA